MNSKMRRVCLCTMSIMLPLALVAGSMALTQGTGILKRITVHSANDRDSGSPDLSADGSWIAFESDSDFFGQGITNEQTEIWLYNAATMTFTRVTTASANDRVSYRPRLSADGTKIVFYSDSDFLGQGIPDNQYEIWLYDTTTMTFTRVTTASHAGRISLDQSLSTDGRWLSFMSDSDFFNQGITSGQYEIWLYDTLGATLTRVTTTPNITRTNLFPHLGADGSKVVFFSDADFLGQGIPDNQYEIWLYNTAAMTLTRITTASVSDRGSSSPYLSADGTLIAFHSNSDFLGQGISNQQFEIWLYDMTAMTLTRITTASNATRGSFVPQLSADGTKIVFMSDSDFLNQGLPDNQNEIWLYDTATMTFTRVTSHSSPARDSGAPQMSADGSEFSFRSDADFLSQGIFDEQYEVWLYSHLPFSVYLPVVLKNSP